MDGGTRTLIYGLEDHYSKAFELRPRIVKIWFLCKIKKAEIYLETEFGRKIAPNSSHKNLFLIGNSPKFISKEANLFWKTLCLFYFRTFVLSNALVTPHLRANSKRILKTCFFGYSVVKYLQNEKAVTLKFLFSRTFALPLLKSFLSLMLPLNS